jgi:uncharacterized protein (TIGR02145 family)
MNNKVLLFGCIFFLLLGCDSAFKDQNGNKFEIVEISNEIWMAENLNVDKFKNGESILEAKNINEWIKLCKENQPAWCYLDFDYSNGLAYGKLYNKIALLDSRGISPEGWRVSSEADFVKMESALGMGDRELAGKNMKSLNKNGKKIKNTGFFALPARYLDENKFFSDDYVTGGSIKTSWWTSNSGSVYLNFDYYDNPFSILHIAKKSETTIYQGNYIRCIKNK